MHLFFFLLLFCSALHAAPVSSEDAHWIGSRIFHNECSSKVDRLVWWNENEEFASLGIGHFIWYPEGKTGPYRETFPSLVAFMKSRGEKIPAPLGTLQANPWETRAAFLKEKNSPYQQALRTFLKNTIALQTEFILHSFEKALPELLNSFPVEMRSQIEKKLAAIASCKQGRYALLDYMNFKGSGTLESERYQGRGWGLKQVLEEMPLEWENSLEAFAETAKKVMRRRVENAPKERREERWLAGWLNRIDSYLNLSQ